MPSPTLSDQHRGAGPLAVSRRRRLAMPAAATILLLALTACGGSSDAESTATTTPTADASPGGGGGAGPGGLDLASVRTCLEAAGLDVSALPTSVPTDLPSGVGTPPEGFTPGTGTPPSGSGTPPAGADGAGGFGVLASAEAQQALAACGISLPTGGPSPAF